MKAWALTKQWGMYEQVSWEVLGIFTSLHKAKDAADADLALDHQMTGRVWKEEKPNLHSLDVDFVYTSGRVNYYAEYIAIEMELQ